MILNMTHDVNMSNTDLNMILQLFFNKLAALTDTVQKLKTQIMLMQLSTLISIDIHDEFENDFESHTEFFMKSEK